jgi:signal transduction histidine kinase
MNMEEEKEKARPRFLFDAGLASHDTSRGMLLELQPSGLHVLNEYRPPLLCYGVAVAAVALALALTLLFRPFLDPDVFSLFFAAVMVSAWYGSLGPGLLATGLAVLLIDAFLLYPVDLNLHSFLRLIVFIVVALLISSLTAARKRAEAALRKAHDELEMRVQERTTELAQANQELWRLQREMGRVEPLAALGRITGTIAHELGTPLNSVLGYSQLLAQEELSESARESLTVIETQIQRMVDIIHHYLSRTRGAVRKYRQVDLNALIRETLVLLEPVFRQHRVRAITVLAEALPSPSADEASMQRVFINLLNNAVDAMENGGTVTITTRAATPPETAQPGAIVEVSDTGVGIPPAVLSRIFDLFVTTKASGKGTGLGLAVCQEIMKGHGGTIKISSQVGEGTCVRIFLPTEESIGRAVPTEEKR